jgi:hypothetical protein
MQLCLSEWASWVSEHQRCVRLQQQGAWDGGGAGVRAGKDAAGETQSAVLQYLGRAYCAAASVARRAPCRGTQIAPALNIACAVPLDVDAPVGPDIRRIVSLARNETCLARSFTGVVMVRPVGSAALNFYTRRAAAARQLLASSRSLSASAASALHRLAGKITPHNCSLWLQTGPSVNGNSSEGRLRRQKLETLSKEMGRQWAPLGEPTAGSWAIHPQGGKGGGHDGGA